MAYTHSEMLAIWRRRLGLPGPENAASVETVAAVAIDDIIADHMRQWYLRLLDLGDPQMVEARNIASQLPLTIDAEGVVTTTLPDNVHALMSVKLAGWRREAFMADPESPLAMWQWNPYCRSTVRNPVGVRHGYELTLYGLPSGATPRWVRALAAVDDGPAVYNLRELALGSIPPRIAGLGEM